ncbi:MAG: hypothetical protein ACREH3_01660 [Geminicoccales bacterium]
MLFSLVVLAAEAVAARGARERDLPPVTFGRIGTNLISEYPRSGGINRR